MSPGNVLLHRPMTAAASTFRPYSGDLLDAHHDEEEEEGSNTTNHNTHQNQNNNNTSNNLPPLHPSAHPHQHHPHEDRLNYMVPGDPVDPPPHHRPHPHQQHPHLHPHPAQHPHMSVLPSSAMSASSPSSATLKRNVRPGAPHQQPPQQQHPPHHPSHPSYPSDLPPGMNAPQPGLSMTSHLPHLETLTSLPPPPSHLAAATAPLHPPQPPTTGSTAPTTTSGAGRGGNKRKAAALSAAAAAAPHSIDPSLSSTTAEPGQDQPGTTASPRAPKKSRTNTPWSPAEEQRLKAMRDAGSSWSDIAKTFPTRTEGSVKKHWYKDMHYAEFAEDESAALLAAIKEYEANKWKVIGQKVGKPAKACEQYAKEHFGGKST